MSTTPTQHERAVILVHTGISSMTAEPACGRQLSPRVRLAGPGTPASATSRAAPYQAVQCGTLSTRPGRVLVKRVVKRVSDLVGLVRKLHDAPALPVYVRVDHVPRLHAPTPHPPCASPTAPRLRTSLWRAKRITVEDTRQRCSTARHSARPAHLKRATGPQEIQR